MSVIGGIQDNLVIDSVKVTVIERGKEAVDYYIPRQVSMVLGWDEDGNFGVVAGGGGGGGTPYSSSPAALGTASAGASSNYARGDHVHPTPFGRAAHANNSGNETVTPTNDKIRRHVAVITVGGSAEARKIILDVADRATGDVIRLLIKLPSTSGISFSVRNATAGGTEVYDCVTDGVAARNITAEFEFNGTAWERVFAIDPA